MSNAANETDRRCSCGGPLKYYNIGFDNGYQCQVCNHIYEHHELKTLKTHFQQHLEHCSQVVSTWPAADQALLGGTPREHHISPNGAEVDSIVHDAEAWLLKQGMQIPLEKKLPHMYRAMIDDYMESPDYDHS